MPGEKTYKVKGEVFDIPESEVPAFLKDNPSATEVQSFVKGKDTLDIPVHEVPDFLKDVPDAKPLKKKELSPSPSPSPLLSNSSATGSPSMDGSLDSSGNLDYLNGGNYGQAIETQQAPIKNLPPETTLDKDFNPIQGGKFIDTPQQVNDKILDIQDHEPDLLRAATTPVTTTANDQKNYDPKLQKQLYGNQAQEAIIRGGTHLVNSVLKTPAFLYDAAAAASNAVLNAPLNAVTGGRVGYMPSSEEISQKLPADNPVAALDQAEANSKKLYDAQYNKQIHEYFYGKDKDYEKGFEALGLGVLENAPTTFAMMFGNASVGELPTLLGSTAVFGADEMSQLEKDPEAQGLSHGKKVAIAAGGGALEGIGESLFGVTTLGSAVKNIFEKDGAEAAAKAAKDGFIKTYGKLIARYVGVGAEEVTSEMATQFAQNLNYKYSGYKPGLDPMTGVADAGLLAMGTSVGTAGPVALMDVVKTKKAIKKAADITTTQDALNKDLASPDVPEGAKPIISRKIQDLNEEAAALAADEKKKFDELTPQGQEAVNDLIQHGKQVADAANAPTVSEDTRSALMQDVKQIDDAVDKVYETEKKTDKEAIQEESKAPESNDVADEIDFLNTMKEAVGLEPEQEARLSELQKSQSNESNEKSVPDTSGGQEVSPVSEANKESVPAAETITPDATVNGTSEAVQQTQKEDLQDSSGDSESEIDAIKKKIHENNLKYYSESETPDKQKAMAAYIEYKSVNQQLTDQLKEAENKQQQNGKNKRKRQGQREDVLGASPSPAEASQTVAPTATLNEKTDQDATKTVGQGKAKPSEGETKGDQEEPEVTTKREKHVDELAEEVTPEDEVKDNPESLKKLDDEIAAMKVADEKDMDKKFVGMLGRAYKMKEEGKISKPTYDTFKNKVKDVYTGKKDISAEEMKIRSTALIEKVKQKLLGEGYKNMALSTGIPITPKTVADFLDLANHIIHKLIDTKVGLTQATKEALDIIKKHPTYKKLVASGELNEKQFESELGKIKSEKKEEPKKEESKKESKKREYEEPKKPGSTENKSLSNRMFNAENLSQDVRNKIEKFGLTYSQFSNTEAHEIAKEIVAEKGIDGALVIARSSDGVSGGVKTMIYAEIINHYYNEEAASKTDFDRNHNANMQGYYEDELDQYLRDNGRAVSATQQFYKTSPAGIAAKEVAGLRRENQKKVTQNGLTADKEAVLSVLNGSAPKSSKKPTREKLKEIRSKRESLLEKLKKSWDAPSGPKMKSGIPLRDEHVVLMAKIAATYIEEGVVRTDALIKKIKTAVKKTIGIKLTSDDLERIMNEKVGGEKIRDTIDKIDKGTPLTEKEKEIEEKRKLDVLNRMMPRSRKKTAKERQTDHEKMIAAYNAGAFDGAGRTYTGPDRKQTTETFEDLFYERHGLANVNKPEFKAKMKEFATEISKTPEHSALRNNAYQSMYNYIANYQARTRLSAAANLVMDVFYAHILSSYETHIRNMKYNSTIVGINQTLLMAEKKLLKGQFGEFKNIISDAAKGISIGMTEAWQVLRNGAVSRFDKPGIRNALENTNSKWLKFHKIPGRALRAADIMSTVPLYDMKQRELMYDYVKKEAKEKGEKLSSEEVEQKVLEYLGKTPQRVETAKKRAAEDIEKVYGPSWKSDKVAVANYKIRIAEVMEETRPEAVKEESIQWARRAVLTNEPRGIWRNVANMLNEVGKIPGGKFIVPFVNIAVNLSDRMIERTPISFINAIRGKKGFGATTEKLTDDEVHELTLKAINYSVGVVALLAAVGAADDDDDVVITGKNTGDYSKEQSNKEGGKLDPFSVYIKGKKAYEYKDSPLASLLAPVGYYRDYVKYGENDGSFNGAVKSGFDYMTFVVELNAMKGLNNFINAISPEQYRQLSAESVGKSLASTAQNLYMPNVVKAVNNDVRGAFGYNDKKVDDWHDAFFKDVPYVESLMLDDKYDHLGQPIKDQFKMPLVPYEKWQPVDPYYKFFTDHKYYPTHMKDKIVVVGNAPEDSESFTEVRLSKDNIRTLEKIRGDIVKGILNTDVGEGKTVMQEMGALSEDKFSSQMDQIFSKAGKLAKTRFFNGNEVRYGNKKEDQADMEKEISSSINDVIGSLSE